MIYQLTTINLCRETTLPILNACADMHSLLKSWPKPCEVIITLKKIQPSQMLHIFFFQRNRMMFKKIHKLLGPRFNSLSELALCSQQKKNA